VTPSGKVALGKLAQALVYGSRVMQLEGNFDALSVVVELAQSKMGLYLLNSINPYRFEGKKTLACEAWDQLGGRIPDTIILPIGNAGNISAIWKGSIARAQGSSRGFGLRILLRLLGSAMKSFRIDA